MWSSLIKVVSLLRAKLLLHPNFSKEWTVINSLLMLDLSLTNKLNLARRTTLSSWLMVDVLSLNNSLRSTISLLSIIKMMSCQSNLQSTPLSLRIDGQSVVPTPWSKLPGNEESRRVTRRLWSVKGFQRTWNKMWCPLSQWDSHSTHKWSRVRMAK